MIFCRHCGKAIHELAPSCPQCGGVQPPSASSTALPHEGGSLWMAITSLVLGIVFMLVQLDDSVLDKETLIGMGLFICAGLVLGVISLAGNKAGKGLAIAGVVLSSLALLVLLGSS